MSSAPGSVAGPTFGSPSRAAGLGDRRGLTATGGVALALLLGAAGAAYDVVTGSGLGLVFAVSFVVGSALAALLVHREDLAAAVVMPPLTYVVLAVVAGAVEGGFATGSFVVKRALELVNAVVLGAPVLVTATVVTLVVAVTRGLGRRR